MSFRFIPNEYRIRHATEGWERRGCAELRRAVFCEEQRVFENSDVDPTDEIAIPIAAVACVIGVPEQVVGTVRIHESEPRVWWGSRLAVHEHFRGVASIGKELIRHAVCTAHARGCDRFLAYVQEQNVRLFRHLHWSLLEMASIHGRPHGLMQADLSRYPPRQATDIRLVNAAVRAAA